MYNNSIITKCYTTMTYKNCSRSLQICEYEKMTLCAHLNINEASEGLLVDEGDRDHFIQGLKKQLV